MPTRAAHQISAKHGSLTHFNTPVLRGKTHTEGTDYLSPTRDFCYNIWGAYPPDRPGIATEQTKLHLTHCMGFTPSNTNHAPYQGDRASTPLRKDGLVSISKSALMPKTLDKTQSTQGHSHVKYPSRPQ